MHRRLLLPLFLCLLSPYSFANSISLPDIGDSAGTISPAEEYRTGEAVIRNIRRAGGVLDDPLSHDYLNDLGYRLVAASETQQPFNFFLINDTAINAFALPGGFIGINAGLILASESESEIAGVMAHEIAHVTQRHHARQYEQGSNSIPVIAALIAAMVLGSQDNDVGQAALASVAAGSMQKQINFTRENEKEADRIGIDLLIKAEFNPHGMPAFFEQLDKQSRIHGDNIPEFLRSHPVNPARIADSRHRASKYPNVLTSSSISYYLLRARLTVLTSKDKNGLIKYFSSVLEKGNYQNQDAARYGYALALKENAKYELALKHANILLKKNPEQIAYQLLKAEIETAAKKFPSAVQTFQDALKLYPNNNTISLYFADTLLKANQLQKAHKILQKQVSLSTSTPELYRMLAETEAKLNKPAHSNQALAEYYYLRGQTHEAIKQIELGLKIPNIDFYLVSRLEARLKELKEELHQIESSNN